MSDNILIMKQITKTYPGVTALNQVSITLGKGETLALVGENGAGKSTLIKVLSGAITPDSGEIELLGKQFHSMTPIISKEMGVAVIYQEFNLMPTMSVAENIFMGEHSGTRYFFNKKVIIEKTEEIFREMGVHIDPGTAVKDLSVAYMQLVEIAKALSRDAKILVMDEPTAPLTDAEVEILFTIIRKLKARGISIIYISHRLNEIFQIADRVTVLRDGERVYESNIGDLTRDILIRHMVGREIKDQYPKREVKIGDDILKVEHLFGNGDKDISFSLRKGEILGIAGLVGAGRTELARVIFGAEKMDSGRILLDGKEYVPSSPGKAVDNEIGLIPEDRKNDGLILNFPIKWNITLSILKQLTRMMFIKEAQEQSLVDKLISDLLIKTPSSMQKAGNLSGGNQQKVVLAKWLAVKCKVLIFDEPTRGIDVGAKYEIYKLMNNLCEQGVGIIMISSDMEEIMGMTDRMIILSEGVQAGELEKKEYSQELILSYASGNK